MLATVTAMLAIVGAVFGLYALAVLALTVIAVFGRMRGR